MNREYHKWYSQSLGREMELLAYGHGGTPVLVFPTSMGKFFEYEDRGMIATLQGKLESGVLRLYCVDSVDGESWYNKSVHPRVRIARHQQYENYVLTEVVPLIQQVNGGGGLVTHGCSFGAYHAMNLALRHPQLVSKCVTMGGAFEIKQFLDGYYDDDCYFHSPHDYMQSMADGEYLKNFRSNFYLLVTGEHDMCWDKNERFAQVLRSKQIPHQLYVWRDGTGHDWPWWQKMAQAYLP
jgi:esterase/lipase superfamily enzyme